MGRCFLRTEVVLLCMLAVGFATDGAVLAKDKAPKIKGPIVEVMLTEYAIQMPSSFKHGWVTLRISNKGDALHGLRAQDSKKTWELAPPIAPGKTVLVPIQLRKGTFMVYCSTAEHATVGMQAVAYVQ